MKYPILITVNIVDKMIDYSFKAEIIQLKPFPTLSGNMIVYCKLRIIEHISDKDLIKKYSIKSNIIDTTFGWFDYGIKLDNTVDKKELFKYCMNQVKSKINKDFYPSFQNFKINKK